MRDIRTYRNDDLASITALLNESHTPDRFTPALVTEKLMGDPAWDPEKVLIFHENGQDIGFMLGVHRDIQGVRYGYIKLMGVAPKHRRRGIARQLYETLERQFLAAGVQVVRIYDVPMNYFMPGIDPRYTPALCFAMRMGFGRFGDTANLSVDLGEQPRSTAAAEKVLEIHGISVRRAKGADQEAVIEFVCREWPLWRHEVMMAFRNSTPTIHLALLHDEVRAFAAYDANNFGTGWFGPMGTDAVLRGKGIGSILLRRCLDDLLREGNKKAVIPWVGPIDFYAHHTGAVVDRVFWRYEKRLT